MKNGLDAEPETGSSADAVNLELPDDCSGSVPERVADVLTGYFLDIFLDTRYQLYQDRSGSVEAEKASLNPARYII
jgi:hypothetical protein